MFDRLALLWRYLRMLPKAAKFRPNGTTGVAEKIEEQAQAFADRPFLLFEDRRWTYADLNIQANRIAHWGRDVGLRRGDVVALLMENRPEYIATWAGLAKLGVTTALINTNLTGKALVHALETANADRMILGTECLDRFETAGDALERSLDVWLVRDPAGPDAGPREGARFLDDALESRPGQNPDPSWREGLRTGDPLFYIYTSGTTGLPKAARFSHLRFLTGGILISEGLELRSDDVSYCALPLYHTAGGVMVVSGALFAGATIALRRKFSATRFWEDCRRYGVTTFQYIGEFCRYLLNQPPSPDDRRHDVRVIIGNGLRPDIWEEFQNRFRIPRIVEFYGATEGNTALVNLENKVGTVGRAPFRFLTNARLVRYDVESDTHPRDERGFCIECEPGEAGELVGAIPKSQSTAIGRFEGYTSEGDTDRKILRDVFRKGDAWFRSGDLLRQDEEGFFYFVDRIGDTFRWKGENVSTQDVAETLTAYPGVEVANVYGVAVEGHDGRAGMAALLLEDGHRFDPKTFYDFVDSKIPRYAAPLFVRLIQEVELTGTFKIRKVTLQKEGFDPERVSDPLFFRDDREKSYIPLTPQVAEEVRAGRRQV